MKITAGLGKAIATEFIYGLFRYQHKPEVLNKFYQNTFIVGFVDKTHQTLHVT